MEGRGRWGGVVGVQVQREPDPALVSESPPPCSVQPTLSSVSRVVTHDIPVEVIPRRLWHEFKEPSVPDFQVGDARPVSAASRRDSDAFCR